MCVDLPDAASQEPGPRPHLRAAAPSVRGQFFALFASEDRRVRRE
jgi:hypothetical protein